MSTGTTPKGYTYPNGDDPIANGDNVITTLAGQIDTNLGRSAQGLASLTPVELGTSVSTVVTFPAGRFTAGPRVSVSAASTNPHGVAVGVQSAPSATSVTIYATKISGSLSAISVTWLAIQV